MPHHKLLKLLSNKLAVSSRHCTVLKLQVCELYALILSTVKTFSPLSQVEKIKRTKLKNSKISRHKAFPIYGAHTVYM